MRMFSKIIILYAFLMFIYEKCVMSQWDFAVSVQNKIIFFDNQWKQQTTAAHQFTKLSSIAFDEIEDKLYFCDQYHNGSIFSIKLPKNNNLNKELKTEIIEQIVTRVENEIIGGLAYDPYGGYLYWVDKSNKQILRLYTSKLEHFDTHITTTSEELFILLNDESIPEGLAIDICNRNLYWTNSNIENPSIEYVSLDEPIVSANRTSKILIQDDLFQPRGISVDYFSKRLFWVVNLPGVHYAVESSNLNGSDRKCYFKGLHNEPFDLTVTKDNIFWSDVANEAIWSLSKSSKTNSKPKQVYTFKEKPRGIISRFSYLNKLANVDECKDVVYTIKKLLKQHTAFNVPKNTNHTLTLKSIDVAKPHIFCLNNGYYNPLSDACVCKIGYSGLRCEFDECANYCVHGNCYISSMGFPECICNEGFYGIRCEAYQCGDFCLNGGYCKVIQNKSICECSGFFGGSRCEQNLTDTCTLFCTLLKFNSTIDFPNNCLVFCKEFIESNKTKVFLQSVSENLKNIKTDIFVNEQTHSENLPIVSQCNSTYTIAVICLSVCLAFTILFLIIVIIRKTLKPPRPKIRKTFVVQKRINNDYLNNCNSGPDITNNESTTPLTSRPLSAVEKCEITIEDCCNMNICDTPCFDPKMLENSFQKCKSASEKGEDKKTLVDHMEEPLY